jgi:hypothetical protein
MSQRRLDLGPLLALVGALLLLVSLFLHWYHPGLTGWDVFEVLDLVLAALAVASLLACLSAIGLAVPAPDVRWLGWCGTAALVIVAATLLNRPPASGDGATDTGIWLALAASACLAAGGLLAGTRIAVHFDVQPRRTRVAAVDTRMPPPPPAEDPTRRLGDPIGQDPEP